MNIWDYIIRRIKISDQKDFEEFCLMIKPDKINLVSSAILIKNKKVLLTKAKNRTFYYPPGGLVNYGETAKQACIREVKEELGVNIKVIRLVEPFIKWNINGELRKSKRRKLVVFYFLVKVVKGTLKKVKSWDAGAISDVVWVDKDELKNIKTYDEVRSICQGLL